MANALLESHVAASIGIAVPVMLQVPPLPNVSLGQLRHFAPLRDSTSRITQRSSHNAQVGKLLVRHTPLPLTLHALQDSPIPPSTSLICPLINPTFSRSLPRLQKSSRPPIRLEIGLSV